jgi:hypothetical protein
VGKESETAGYPPEDSLRSLQFLAVPSSKEFGLEFCVCVTHCVCVCVCVCVCLCVCGCVWVVCQHK